MPLNKETETKPKIGKSQQNSKCRLCGERDEVINHITSECSKLAQKAYKTRHDWVGKMSHCELCKKLKLDHPNNWYLNDPAYCLENETRKLLCYFDIQTDHLISGRTINLIIIKKNTTFRIVNFVILADRRVKLKESEQREKYLYLVWKLKKLCNVKEMITTIVIAALGTVIKGLVQGLEDLEIEGRVETVQTTALLRSARILRRVLETCRDLLSLKI